MKKLYFTILISLLFNDARSDWDLFPLKQKTFYTSASFSENFIVSTFMDTIANRGNYDAHFFNKTHVGATYINLYACFSNLDPTNIISSFPVNGDSLVIRNDTVFYDSTIYFLPQASLGQSWPFKNQTMTCNNIGVMNFSGVTDSVKHFSSGQFNFILSKNYGFVMHVPFYNIAHNSQMTDHTLVGFEESNGTAHGFLKPTYLDFFPYQPGDVLVWKSGLHPPFDFPRINLMRDSITSIIFSPDSIQYFFDQVYYRYDGMVFYQQNAWKKFAVNLMINQLEAPTNWLAIATMPFIGTPSVVGTGKYILENDSSISYVVSEWGSYINDSINCTFGVVSDIRVGNTYNTKKGHTARLSDFFYPDYDSLIGGVLNGVVWGDTALHVGFNEIIQQNSIGLFPNPAADKIYVKSLKKISHIEITNTLGIIIRKEFINESSFGTDISMLPSSLYIINLIDESGSRIKRKFIKN